MSKKVFTGEKQNLVLLAKDVKEWLRKEGFEVQSGAGDGNHLVQARKQTTWRSLLGNNQTIDVWIVGTPENYSIDVNAGSWVKNLGDSGGAGIVAAIATIYSLGLPVAWSALECDRLESSLWRLKDASCPACFKIGAAEATGERFVRAEAVTLHASGIYQGTKVFTDTFRCKFCAHTWDRGEKPRQATLCPKCYDEKALASTGRKITTCKKTQHRSQEGQPLGEQVFTNTFRCNACSHTWNDGEHSQLVEVCPGCLKIETREATGEHVFSFKKTDQYSQNGQPLGQQVFTDKFRCGACSHEWNDGQKTRLVEVCPYCDKPAGIVFLGENVLRNFTRHQMKQVTDMHDNGPGKDYTFTDRFVQIAIDFEAYIEIYQCKFCSNKWNTGEKSRRLG